MATGTTSCRNPGDGDHCGFGIRSSATVWETGIPSIASDIDWMCRGVDLLVDTVIDVDDIRNQLAS